MDEPAMVFKVTPGTYVLSAGHQRGRVVVWILTKPPKEGEPLEDLRIMMTTTGDQAPRGAFIDTVQVPPKTPVDGQCVWHVWKC